MTICPHYYGSGYIKRIYLLLPLHKYNYSHMKQEELITIYSEATPNPESMKFVVNKMILPNDSADYRTSIMAKEESPLATALFENFDFVKYLYRPLILYRYHFYILAFISLSIASIGSFLSVRKYLKLSFKT